MKMNSSGKVVGLILIIFLVIFASLSAATIFLWNKEISVRKVAEGSLEKSNFNVKRMEGELAETKKQNFVLEEKNKEMDERVNSLLDELELVEGVKEEFKLETASLKEKLGAEEKAKNQLREELAKDLGDFEAKVTSLESKLKEEVSKSDELVQRNKELLSQQAVLESKVAELNEFKESVQMSKQKASESIAAGVNPSISVDGVELDEIVVSPDKDVKPVAEIKAAKNDGKEGRILSVDIDTEFVIVNLGKKDGISIGDMMSVFRGEKYLGDIKITRIQPEMAAADLIPPFSSRTARKNDQVKTK